MKVMRRPEIVERIRQTIKKTEPTATAILYGSEARGDARADSDIDVLVLLEGETRDFLKRRGCFWSLVRSRTQHWCSY